MWLVDVRFNFQAVTSATFLILNQFMLTRTSTPLCLAFDIVGRCKWDGRIVCMMNCVCFLVWRTKDPISEEIPLVFHQIFYLLLVFIIGSWIDCWDVVNCTVFDVVIVKYKRNFNVNINTVF